MPWARARACAGALHASIHDPFTWQEESMHLSGERDGN